MSELKMDVPKLSLLDQLRLQRMQFIQQKENAQNSLNQLIGAVFACEILIKKQEDELEENAQKSLEEENEKIECQ
jgi:hypothetical protein